jgi:hypothetical protein
VDCAKPRRGGAGRSGCVTASWSAFAKGNAEDRPNRAIGTGAIGRRRGLEAGDSMASGRFASPAVSYQGYDWPRLVRGLFVRWSPVRPARRDLVRFP